MYGDPTWVIGGSLNEVWVVYGSIRCDIFCCQNFARKSNDPPKKQNIYYYKDKAFRRAGSTKIA